MSKETMKLEQRITDYLSGGGVFNPELANHVAVRDLLIDCRNALAEQSAHQCKWPTCQSEEYQQTLAEQIKRELIGELVQLKETHDHID